MNHESSILAHQIKKLTIISGFNLFLPLSFFLQWPLIRKMLPYRHSNMIEIKEILNCSPKNVSSPPKKPWQTTLTLVLVCTGCAKNAFAWWSFSLRVHGNSGKIKSPNFLLKISYFYGTNDLVKLYDVYFAKLCQEQDAVECYHRLPTLKLMKLRISSVWSFVCLSRLI